MQGDDDAVDALLAWCARSPGARVEKIKADEVELDEGIRVSSLLRAAAIRLPPR